MNSSKELYEFLGKDPVKALYLGIYVTKWFELLDKKQMYLYSKSLRHNQEEIESYLDQMKHWASEFPNFSKEVDAVKLSEFVFNNIVWNQDTEELDKVKVALFLGMGIGKNADLSDEKLLFSVH